MLAKTKIYLLLIAFSCFINLSLQAQHGSNIKLGKISADDFAILPPASDSNAGAVVIADIGSSEFEGNNKGWFTLVYKRIKRIKIINPKGFDIATVSIILYADDGYYKISKDKEVLGDLKAVTYNTDNGTISTSALDVGSVYETTIDKNHVEKKFTFPAVKAGSIIEYSYTIKSDFIFNLQSWYFQGKYPCLWSEYTVHIPDCFAYIFLSKGYNQFYINEKKTEHIVYHIEDPNFKSSSYASVPEQYVLNSIVAVNRWVIKNVPALKEESMVSTTKNYVSKIEFQLAQYRFSDPPENKMHNWAVVNKELLELDDFGGQLDENDWLANEDSKIVNDKMSQLAKAKAIFSFVRDNFSANSHRGLSIARDISFKNIFKTKAGSESGINLLLVSMLRKAGITSDPVILSTRDNGVVHPVYPILARFNYTICRAIINDTPYYLDASNHFLGFNKLSEGCFNGIARPISPDTAVVNLSADSLKEVSTRMIFLSNTSSQNLSGTVSTTLGYNESLDLRTKYVQQGQEIFFKDLSSKFSNDLIIKNGTIDSFKNYDDPARINYDIVYNYSVIDSFIYINPMFGGELKSNPFKGETERLYPIEMPYCEERLLVMDMEVPAGYKVEEIPKSARIKLENDAAIFEYLIQQSGNRIQLRCTFKINKTIYDAEDYTTLQNFYSSLVNKENERIVLKKMN